MWRLLNKLFGWDYVAWTNSADNGIARVHLDGDGRPYYFRYKISKVIDRLCPHNQYDTIIWLTCSSSKYESKTAPVQQTTNAS